MLNKDPEESVEDGVENDKDSIAGTGTGTDDALAQSNYSVGGLGLSILLPSIDPDKWKEETERVAPLLNNLRKINEISFLTEWSSHVELMQKYVKDNILEDCAYQEAVSNSSASSIKIMLRAVNIELREVLKKISSAERTLQGKNSFDSLFLDYEVCTKVNLIKIVVY